MSIIILTAGVIPFSILMVLNFKILANIRRLRARIAHKKLSNVSAGGFLLNKLYYYYIFMFILYFLLSLQRLSKYTTSILIFIFQEVPRVIVSNQKTSICLWFSYLLWQCFFSATLQGRKYQLHYFL